MVSEESQQRSTHWPRWEWTLTTKTGEINVCRACRSCRVYLATWQGTDGKFGLRSGRTMLLSSSLKRSRNNSKEQLSEAVLSWSSRNLQRSAVRTGRGQKWCEQDYSSSSGVLRRQSEHNIRAAWVFHAKSRTRRDCHGIHCWITTTIAHMQLRIINSRSNDTWQINLWFAQWQSPEKTTTTGKRPHYETIHRKIVKQRGDQYKQTAE